MELVGHDGDRLALNIVDYAYPRNVDSKNDANWLLMRIDATAQGQSWSAQDPSLQTWEIEWLARWFDALAANKPVVREVKFLEPNLRFVLRDSEEGVYRIRVFIELELHPAWPPSDDADMVDLWLDLDATRDDLLQAVSDLRCQRKRFPPRAGMDDTRDDPKNPDWPMM